MIQEFEVGVTREDGSYMRDMSFSSLDEAEMHLKYRQAGSPIEVPETVHPADAFLYEQAVDENSPGSYSIREVPARNPYVEVTGVGRYDF